MLGRTSGRGRIPDRTRESCKSDGTDRGERNSREGTRVGGNSRNITQVGAGSGIDEEAGAHSGTNCFVSAGSGTDGSSGWGSVAGLCAVSVSMAGM